MTDDRLDELLKMALAPEIADSDIQIRRKGKKNRMKTKYIAACALAACAALMILFGGINLRSGKPDATMDAIPESDYASETPAAKPERKSNFFVIVSNAEGLSEDAASGDVVNIFTKEESGEKGYLGGRFGISGNNISKVGISIDKGEVFTSVPVYKEDPEFATIPYEADGGSVDKDDPNFEASESSSLPEGEEYFAVDDTDNSAYADGKNAEKSYHYDHISNKGKSFEIDYNENMTFGIHVPEINSKEFTKETYYEMIDQVNDAKITITVTFTDGSQEVHEYNIKTGKIFVPVDENDILQYDCLTRFITDDEKNVPYIYGYLMEKMD